MFEVLKHSRVKKVFLYPLFLMITTMVLMTTSPAQAADQTLGGVAAEGELRVTIRDTGTIGIERYTSGAWVAQVFSNTSKGSRLYINGTHYNLGYYAGGTATAYVSNVTIGNTVTLTRTAAGGNIQIQILITYVSGNSNVTYQFQITNNTGGALTDLRLFHGQDTYFGGGDAGAGFWVAGTNTVGVVKVVSGIQSKLSFSGITVPFAYESRRYADVQNNVIAGALTNTIDANPLTDNGYALEWRVANLANTGTWTIDAGEVITRQIVTTTTTGEVDIGGGGSGGGGCFISTSNPFDRESR